MSPIAAFLIGAASGGLISAVGAVVFLRRRVRSYGRLLSFTLHELNTPITTINMTAVNLLSGVFGEVAPANRQWIEMAHDQVVRLSDLLAEARDLVHLEFGSDIRANMGPADAPEILEGALAAQRRGFVRAGVELVVESDGDLPRATTDVLRAARCLSGLVHHARKFRVKGPVRVRAGRRGSQLAFEVSYEGPIMPPGEAERSLDLLYPARQRADQALSSVGLGLGFVRLVMNRLGGDLVFESDLAGKGRLLLVLSAAKGV